MPQGADDLDRDEALAEIAVGSTAPAGARAMPDAPTIDRVGDDRRRRVGAAASRASTVTASAMPSEKLRRRALRAPEVAMPRTGSRAVSSNRAVERAGAREIGDQRRGQTLARRQVQGDVAAVVDIGALQRRAGAASRKHLIGDAPATAAIGVMKTSPIGPARRDHALRDRTDSVSAHEVAATRLRAQRAGEASCGTPHPSRRTRAPPSRFAARGDRGARKWTSHEIGSTSRSRDSCA